MSLLNPAAFAAERELDHEPPPSSAKEIKTPMERVFEERRVRRPLAEWLREQLEDLPPFFSDTQFEARYRTYYLKQDRTDGSRSEAWAMGGPMLLPLSLVAEEANAGNTERPGCSPHQGAIHEGRSG